MSAPLRRNITPRYETGDDGRPIIPPMITPDLHTRLANPHQYETDPGPQEVLHNVIDFRFPMIAWIITIMTNLDISAFSSNPAASPQSLLGYCFSLVVAFNWFSDVCHNLAPSRYAQSLMDANQTFVNFVEDMLDLNVPSFMAPELLQWQSIFSQFAPTLRRITCFDTADFPHDFGRHFPSTIFFGLHNQLASIAARSTYSEIAKLFYSSTVATVTVAGNAIDLTPANYFAASFRTGTTAPYGTAFFRNWLNQTVDLLLAPNSVRTAFGTVTIRRLQLDTISYTDFDAYNPYTFLMSWNHQNDLPLRSIFSELSDWTKKTFPSAQPLRNYIQTGSRPLVQYLSFRTVLPTWHTQITPAKADYGNEDHIFFATSMTAADFASRIAFCADRSALPNAPDANNILVAPGRDLETPPTGSTRIDLVRPTPSTAPADPANSTIKRSFNTNDMYLAHCRLIQSSELAPASFGPILTSGLLIEVNSISMIGFPTPSPNRPLHLDNSRYCLGGIRLSNTKTAFTGTGEVFFVKRTNLGRPRDTTQFFAYGPSFRMMMPRFLQGIVQTGRNATDANSGIAWLARFFPGAWIYDNVRRAMDTLNYFGQQIDSQNNFIPDNEIVFWSSFRYRHPRTREVYTMPSLEHLTGTQFRMVTSSHPAERITTRR
nr:MAG: putative coat protein [Alphapartitivirus sp.]